MSSFYGNIKFNNQTPLIFDKIYTSRFEMEEKCHSDGIFNGRFILISYGEVQYTPFHKIGCISREEFNTRAGKNLYITATGDEMTEEVNGTGFKLIPNNDQYYYTDWEYFIRAEYIKDNYNIYSQNKALDELHYHHDYHNTVWQKIWTSTQAQEDGEVQEKYIMVSHLNAETPTMTLIVDAPSDAMEIQDENRKTFFPIPTDQGALNEPGIISEEDFNLNKENLLIKLNNTNDFEKVGNREYNIQTIYYIEKNDVKRKVTNSKAYVDGMISEALYKDLIQNRERELYINQNNNYVLVDDPNCVNWNRTTKYYMARYRIQDGRPHFDPIMSTDLEYRYHVPRNWKFNNTPDFTYNIEGFYPEKSSDLGYDKNTILLYEEPSGELYPEHRNDETTSGLYEENDKGELILKKTVQNDTKTFDFDLGMLGDAVSKMWNAVYPKDNPNIKISNRNMFIGNDRDRQNSKDYPGTLAEAVRRLYYWLGLKPDEDRNIKGDNNFLYGPWVDPTTGKEVNTIFGVLNGAASLLGDFDDTFSDKNFYPVAGPTYYPDGFNKTIFNEKGEPEYQLSESEFDKLHNGGAGPLYIKVGENQYDQATEYVNNQQYYRNMNSLLSTLRAWQDIVKDTQGDWTYEGPDEDWTEVNPIHPRYIRNKPIVITVDQKEDGKLYQIDENQNINLETLLKEERLYGYFAYRYQVQVQMGQGNNNGPGFAGGSQTITEWRDTIVMHKIIKLPIDVKDYEAVFTGPAISPISFTGYYYEKHALDPASINWFWKNYAT